MKAPRFDPDGGTLRLRHAPVKPSPVFAVVSVGETRQPSGQPRMPAFSTAFARLYESDKRGATSCVSSDEPAVGKSACRDPILAPCPAPYPAPCPAPASTHLPHRRISSAGRRGGVPSPR